MNIKRFLCRGLPRDEGDDLLAGDMSALRLSDNDVYAQTARSSGAMRSQPPTSQEPGVIHVNPPLADQTGYSRPALSVEEQIRADEELARRLARDDQFWENRGKYPFLTWATGICCVDSFENAGARNDNPPQMPTRTPSGLEGKDGHHGGCLYLNLIGFS